MPSSDSFPRLRQAPLLAPAIAFSGGLVAPAALTPASVATFGLLATLLAPLYLQTAKGRTAFLLWVAPALLGLAAAPAVAPVPAERASPPGEGSAPRVYRGRVVTPPRPRWRNPRPGEPRTLETRFLVRLNGDGASIQVTTAGDPALGRGDRIRLLGRMGRGSRVYVGRPEHLRVEVSSGDPRGWLDRARRRIRRHWQQELPDRVVPWLAAIGLGDRGLLPQSIPRRFRRVGQSHVLAISGLHMGILVALLMAPLRRLSGPPRRVGRCLLLMILVLYAGLVGGDVPVLRALVFGVLAHVAIHRGARSPTFNALAVALLLLGGGTPGESGRASFVFSFCAVAGIAFLTPQPAAGSGKFRRALRVSLGAWLGTTVPLLWWTPDVVPAAPLFSLVVVPVTALLLGQALVAIVLATLPFDFTLPILGSLADVTVSALETLIHLLDRCPGTPATWPPLPPLTWALALVSLFVWRHRMKTGATLLLALGVLRALSPSAPTALEVLDVGRGQAALLRTPSATVLFDAGSLDRPEGGTRAVREALRRHGRGRIDVLVLSHAHLDHVNAAPTLASRLPIGLVLVGPRFSQRPLGRGIIRNLESRQVPVRTVARGDRVRVGQLVLEVSHPPRVPSSWLDRANDDSLVVRARGEGWDLQVCGDLEQAGLALAPPPESPLVILPHHGRFAPGLDTWLARGRVTRVLASSSRGLSDATREVIDRLALTCWDTGSRGTVVLRSGQLTPDPPRPR